ncbi:MAG: tRNA pseudouridine(55) synthase TruB [Bacillota bacterium]|jgi:tRNA pseudouridine55 synthase
MEGFININKEAGKTSHDIVAAIRRLLNCRINKIKVGHTGTLDPMATGVLPICLGKATRLAEYITDCSKTYRAEVIFGIETDSYDAEGAIIAKKSASHIKEQQVLELLPCINGCIEQMPPLVSALKYQGQPLYKLARTGQPVSIKPRAVTIYDIIYNGGNFEGENPSIDIEITCSKGTYIRSVAHDLGKMLAVGAHLSRLTRTRVGPFSLDNAYTVDEIAVLAAEGRDDFILPLSYGIGHLPLVVAKDEQAQRLCHGNSALITEEKNTLSVCRVEDKSGRLLGIGRVKDGILTMTKVLVGVE